MDKLISVAVGKNSSSFESALVEELKVKIDKVDAKFSVYQSLIDKLLLTGGDEYTYLNVNKWVLRNYGEWFGYPEYCRLFPVIGDYVYTLRDRSVGVNTTFNVNPAKASDEGYMILDRYVDVSTPTKFAAFCKATAGPIRTNYNIYYGTTITEDYEPSEYELLIKCKYVGGYEGSLAQNIGPSNLLSDYKNGQNRRFFFSTNTSVTDRMISFEILKYGIDENKYIRGLVFIVSAGVKITGGVFLGGKLNGITVMNNDVSIGEVRTDISFEVIGDLCPVRVFYINLNPLLVTTPFTFK